jgi:hypothetical protein
MLKITTAHATSQSVIVFTGRCLAAKHNNVFFCSHRCRLATISQLIHCSNCRFSTNSTTEAKLCYDRRSVGQSILVSSPHLGPKSRLFVTVVGGALLILFSFPSVTRRTMLELLESASSQFVLASSLLRLTTWDYFFQPYPCSHSPYVTPSLTRGCVCFLWIFLAYVKCKYRIYTHIYAYKFFPFNI